MKPNYIYPVYILNRVVEEIYYRCMVAVPNETMGKLLGYCCVWQQKKFIRIVDWSVGSLQSSHTHAQFTQEGTRECELFLDERYGKKSNAKPIEIGIFHSHPFNTNPHFSQTDYNTFLSFPYDKEGNIFILIDPLANYFKTYQIQIHEKTKLLEQVPWISYTPQIN